MAEAVRVIDLTIYIAGAEQAAAQMDALARSEQGAGASSKELEAAHARMEAQIMRRIAASIKLADTRNREIATTRQIATANEDAMRSYTAANDNIRSVGDAYRSTGLEAVTTAAHIKTAAAALYVFSPAFRGLVTDVAKSSIVTGALRTMGSAAVATGGVIVSALTPALAFVSRIAIPAAIVIELFRAMNAIAALGEAKFKELNDLAANASKAGVGTDTFQRQTQAAKEFSIDAKTATDAMVKFNDASMARGGEGVIEKRLKELTELGNFTDNAGVTAYQRAATTEERYRAVVTLITTAMERGERLAALDLASKFLPAEMLDRLRASSTFLSDLQRAAAEIKPAELISAADVGYATDLKKRIEESERILSEKWAPLQRDLTQLGLNYKESWVVINEMLATAVGYATSLYGWFKGIADFFAKMGNAAWI